MSATSSVLPLPASGRVPLTLRVFAALDRKAWIALGIFLAIAQIGRAHV